MIKVLSIVAMICLSFAVKPVFAQLERNNQFSNIISQNNFKEQEEMKFDIAGYTVIKKSIAYIQEKDQLIAPSLQIISKNGVVFEIKNDPERIAFTKIFFGLDGAQTQTTPVDLEGNGSKYLIMSTFSGGVDCCYNYYLIFLDPDKIEVRQVINALGGRLRFEKSKDNAYQIKVNDTTLIGFYLDEKEAYQPEITLAYNSSTRTFEPDFRFLKQDINDAIFDEIKKITSQAVEKLQREYGSLDIILKPIVINASKLAYNGNYQLSKRLINEVWPKNYIRISRERFQNSFACRLKKSPYVTDLTLMNPDLSKVTCSQTEDSKLDPLPNS